MRITLPPWLAGNRRRQAIAAGAAGVGLVVVLAAVLLAAGAFSGGGDSPDKATATATPSASPTPTPKPTRPTLLNGRLVSPEELRKINKRLPLAVMLDNFVGARPQEGLDQADLVFEAVAEGGITRFLAVFWSRDPGAVLPVRSGRAYYIDWALGLDAIYVHFGFARSADPAADVPSTVERLGALHFDGFFMGVPYFERDPGRASPHNAMAHTDLLWSQAADNGWDGPPQLKPWRFKSDRPQRAKQQGANKAAAVTLGFGGRLDDDYTVRWMYDPKTNGYLRSQGGQPHKDGRSDERIVARNVAVIRTTVRGVPGESHLVYGTTGEGEAVVFQDGVAIEGTWSKPEESSHVRFFNAQGREIAFNRGQTWIEVLSPTEPLQY